jgi:DNA recombination protein RmuC
MTITAIVSFATLLIGFILAWILKGKQAPADTIILKNNYDQVLSAQKEQNELIEKLRASEKEAQSQATIFETRYQQQEQELQLTRAHLQQSQDITSKLQSAIAGNAVKQQAAEDTAIELQQQVIQLKSAIKEAEETLRKAQQDSGLQQQEIFGLRIQLQNATEKISELQAASHKKETDLTTAFSENRQSQATIIELKAALDTKETELQLLRQNMTQQETRIAELNQTQLLEFRNIANKILEDNTQKFTTVNEEKMNAVLSPFKTSITEFKKKVEDTYDLESKERFALGKEIDKLVKQSSEVSLQAANLTNALKNNNKQQGNFGEMILESILENSGLIKGTQYVTQEYLKDNAGRTIKDESGNALQPDVMIICPDKRRIIIDSKISLLDYEVYVNAETKDAATIALNKHVQSVKNHIIQLSKKNYPKYAEALDYVLMFMPVEPAFLEALKADTNLWKFAYDKGIVLVSPTNLLAVLKIIQEMWKVDSRNQNAEEIAKKAGEVYDKFANFLENFDIIGSALKTANSAYDDGYKQLATGKGNFSQKVQQLKDMGGRTQKSISDTFLKEV